MKWKILSCLNLSYSLRVVELLFYEWCSPYFITHLLWTRIFTNSSILQSFQLVLSIQMITETTRKFSNPVKRVWDNFKKSSRMLISCYFCVDSIRIQGIFFVWFWLHNIIWIIHHPISTPILNHFFVSIILSAC